MRCFLIVLSPFDCQLAPGARMYPVRGRTLFETSLLAADDAVLPTIKRCYDYV